MSFATDLSSNQLFPLELPELAAHPVTTPPRTGYVHIYAIAGVAYMMDSRMNYRAIDAGLDGFPKRYQIYADVVVAANDSVPTQAIWRETELLSSGTYAVRMRAHITYSGSIGPTSGGFCNIEGTHDWACSQINQPTSGTTRNQYFYDADIGDTSRPFGAWTAGGILEHWLLFKCSNDVRITARFNVNFYVGFGGVTYTIKEGSYFEVFKL